MRASELLRKFVDMLDQQESGGQNDTQPQAELTHVEVDQPDGTDATTMIPPLQQKLELLKKAVDVPNAFDSKDELDDIKKLTGIKAVITHEADEDLPG